MASEFQESPNGDFSFYHGFGAKEKRPIGLVPRVHHPNLERCDGGPMIWDQKKGKTSQEFLLVVMVQY